MYNNGKITAYSKNRQPVDHQVQKGFILVTPDFARTKYNMKTEKNGQKKGQQLPADPLSFMVGATGIEPVAPAV
jgi:hypothetical protein